MSYETLFEKLLQGEVPSNASDWEVSDEIGWTVAHAAAVLKLLPGDFTQWHLVDQTGWSVAHVAAASGCLPKNFHEWFMEGGTNSISVAEVAMLNGHLPTDFPVAAWGVELAGGGTLAHAAVENDCLLPDYVRHDRSVMLSRNKYYETVIDLLSEKIQNSLKLLK